MEKEVKKKRVVKKASVAKEDAQEVEKVAAAVAEKPVEKPKKTTRKPRVKKAEKTAEEKVETLVEKTAQPQAVLDDEKTETFVKQAVEKYEEVRETPKAAKKSSAKNTKKTEEVEQKRQIDRWAKDDYGVRIIETALSQSAAEKEEKPVEEKHELTRQEKKDAVKGIVKELLSRDKLRRGALIEEASKLYVERYPSDETVNVNDVKGRVGSIITLMEQGEEVFYTDGLMGLEKPVKGEEKKDENDEKPVPVPTKSPIEETHLPILAPESKLAHVFDMSALLGEKKAEKKPDKKQEKKTEVVLEGIQPKVDEKAEKPKKEEKKPVKKTAEPTAKKSAVKVKPQDKLKEKFLKKIRSHGGSYLEYYAVYLLQRYAQANGRRLEGMRICGGERDGGIDGEIELTDTFGFRETLYIQAKNWEPTDEKWMVGETLLQQFIGAVTYRMVQSGKAHGRGVYVTTSKFSEGARKMLDDMSDKYVGYDGDELFDLAKECKFGLIEKDDEWTLDEKLLAGEKAFFNL